MSTRVITTVECDECGEAGSEAYRVEALGSTVTLDLCEAHVKPLRELVDRFAELGEVTVNGKRRRSARREPRHTPRSVDELVASGELVCPSCGRTDFKALQGLNAHRARAHGYRKGDDDDKASAANGNGDVVTLTR